MRLQMKRFLFLTVSIFCFLWFLGSGALEAVSVQSTWIPGPTTPPVINGTVTAGEWEGSGCAPILVGTSPIGYILVRNDLTTLYILLDITNDITNDPVPMQDSFRLTVDVKGDKNIEPNVDVQYTMLPFTSTLGIQYYLGPGSYTPIQALPADSTSALGVGFGGSPIITSPAHRMWEMALSFSEIGISPETWTSGATPIVRVGVRVISTNPAASFNTAVPGNFETDFTDLMVIYLGNPSLPVDPSAPIFKGVGYIPRSNMTDGYADTWSEPMPILKVKDAPFGGTIDVKGDFAALKVHGATHYKIEYSKNSGPYQPLIQTWSNYTWDSTTEKYIHHAIVPDGDGKYACLPEPLNDWFWDDLLLRWNTTSFGNGKYDLKVTAYNISGTPFPVGTFTGETLTVVIDNTPPQTLISRIYHDDGSSMTEVVTCGTIPFISAAPTDGFRFKITAIDNEGHLYDYYLNAHYGNNKSRVAIPVDYYVPSHVDENGTNLWYGKTDYTYPPLGTNPWKPDPTLTGICAHQFRLSAHSRTINGYCRLYYNEYNSHICIQQ
jgi:hypothetical protein